MMKILCIHQSSELYGSDRSFLSSINAFPQGSSIDTILPAEGPLSHLIAENFNKPQFFNRGILRKNLLKRHVFFLWEIAAAIFFYKKKFSDYDIIYINTVVMISAITAARFFTGSNKKIFCHIREIPPQNILFLFKQLIKFSKVKIIYNSYQTKKSFGLPGTVIHNGVALPKINSESNDRQFKKGNTIRILLIGRINSWKGHLFFIDVLKSLSSNVRKKLFIDIVGSPPPKLKHFESELKEKIKKNGLSEIIKITPFQEKPEAHFINSDFVIVPSILPEPFGRVAAEGMSFGKPIIAAAHGGLTEIVTDSLDGFLFKPNDLNDLNRVLNEITKMCSIDYSSLSENALKTYHDKFTEDAYIENLSNLFRCTIKN